ncbi:MAG: hypothetical protein RLZZ299_1345 [Pseudomonadota bacterium]|jgi:two-component system phosphate regulon sensor histidine kinase PhoR
MEDLYHLRGILTLTLLFGATVALPAVLLAYYGLVGLRAQQAAGAADVERRADSVLGALRREVERSFEGREARIGDRVASGASLTADLPDVDSTLRVVFQFDADADLVGAWLRPTTQAVPVSGARLFAPIAEAEHASPPRAATLYAQAVREAKDPATRAWAQILRANTLVAEGKTSEAEAAYRRVAADDAAVRDPRGFRLGDLARLRLGELQRTREPLSGDAALRRLVEDVVEQAWLVGVGAEGAIARRALATVASRGTNAWTRAWQARLAERSEQAYWAQRLLPELDVLLGAGRPSRPSEPGVSWSRTPSAVWATAWKDDGRIVFAFDAGALSAEVERAAERLTADEGDLRVILVSPEQRTPSAALGTDVLSTRLAGWRAAAVPRDPEALAARQAEERLRGSGIVLLSILLLGVGAFASARLVQRELDLARDKADFAAHVSHELRSPITQIRLKAEALQLGLATSQEATARYYDAIVRESERLSRLVDNMLDFAAIERGVKKYTLRPGDLGGTIHRTVESARVAMETRRMTIELQLPDDLPPVWHDVDAVSQVMTNLLSNAAKYGQDAGWIGVTVEASPEEVRVAVSDRGIGIAREEQEHVFQQYWRSADPQARRRKGTGIGLTIVKYVMEAHGGRVVLQSAPGQGTTFTLHFPTRAPPAEAQARRTDAEDLVRRG